MDDLVTVFGLVVVIGTLAVVAIVIIAMAFTSGTKYSALEPYKLGKEWKHEPLLLSATDIQPVAPAGHGHDDTELIGGSASGKW